MIKNLPSPFHKVYEVSSHFATLNCEYGDIAVRAG